MATASVKVLFFAKAKEIVERNSGNISIGGDGQTISYSQLLNKLQREFPALEKLQGKFILALNEEYLSSEDNVTLKVGDELAIIPPISGG